MYGSTIGAQWIVKPPFSRIAQDVKLGKNVRITGWVNLYGCAVGDDSRIGPFVEIQKGANVGRRVKLSSHSFQLRARL